MHVKFGIRWRGGPQIDGEGEMKFAWDSLIIPSYLFNPSFWGDEELLR
jgi:hypothetical protein